MQCWKFRADRTWVLEQEFNICNSNRSEVTSVCLHPTYNALFWCEQRMSSSGQPGYCICTRKVSNSKYSLFFHSTFNTARGIYLAFIWSLLFYSNKYAFDCTGDEAISELGPVEAIMHNICLCHLNPLQQGIAIIIK